jgi:hypothetical protein
MRENRLVVDKREETINELLGAMLGIRQQFTIHAHSLHTSRQADVEVEVFRQGDTPWLDVEGASPVFGIDGWVDAPFDDGHSVVWAFSCWRSESGWLVTRDVTLYPNNGREEVVNHLAEATSPGSAELAAALPTLIEDLLKALAPAL